MRRSLAGVALAVTSMVALSFLIPLAALVMSLVKEQGVTAAEQRAAALAPVLALSTDPAALRESAASLDAAEHLVVHLPDTGPLGSSKAPAELLERAQQGRESISQEVPHGWICLQPVVLPGEQVAVIENFVPEEELTRGVKESWAVMLFLAVGLIGGSVLVADRLGAKVVRSSKRLAQASRALGQGDLDTRVEPMGPKELREAGVAFNAMAHRMTELLAVERELVADLSHRLRTPLTALHLASERMAGTPESARVEAAVGELETELQAIIATARTPLAVGPMGQGMLAAEPLTGDRAAGPGAPGPAARRPTSSAAAPPSGRSWRSSSSAAAPSTSPRNPRPWASPRTTSPPWWTRSSATSSATPPPGHPSASASRVRPTPWSWSWRTAGRASRTRTGPSRGGAAPVPPGWDSTSRNGPRPRRAARCGSRAVRWEAPTSP